jgi:hypothetical protein
MPRAKNNRDAYDWMLALSSEGWAWEFLRRNPDYRHDYFSNLTQSSSLSLNAATRWGLLQLADPDLDARTAEVFWSPSINFSVLPLVIAGEGGPNGLSGIRCRTTVLETGDPNVRHVLFSGEGRFLQLTVSGAGSLHKARHMIEALPEHGKDRKYTALRRLSDLAHHKRLRPHLYTRQRRAPRLAHLAVILDSYGRNPAHRAIAQDVFGEEKADSDWDNLRDHIRRAVAAGRRLSQTGYLEFLG